MFDIDPQDLIVVNPSTLFLNDITKPTKNGAFLCFAPYGYSALLVISHHCLKELLIASVQHNVVSIAEIEDWLSTYEHNKWRRNA